MDTIDYILKSILYDGPDLKCSITGDVFDPHSELLIHRSVSGTEHAKLGTSWVYRSGIGKEGLKWIVQLSEDTLKEPFVCEITNSEVDYILVCLDDGSVRAARAVNSVLARYRK